MLERTETKEAEVLHEKLSTLKTDLVDAEVRNDTDAQADIDAEIEEVRERLAQIEENESPKEAATAPADIPASEPEKKGFFSKLFGRG